MDLMDGVDDKGSPLLSIKEQVQVLERGMALQKHLEKVRTERDDSAGVEALRGLLEDPAQIVERLHKDEAFIAALKAKGWLPQPKRRLGRPSEETLAERAAYAERKRKLENKPPPEEDDSAFQAMIKGQKH